MRETSTVHDDRRFELKTDHRPLYAIYSSKSKPSMRIDRLVLRIKPCDLNKTYIHRQEQAFVIHCINSIRVAMSTTRRKLPHVIQLAIH